MNLSMIRSGDEVFVNAEYIKGYAFKSAAHRVESAHFFNHVKTAAGSSHTSRDVAC